MAEDMPIDSLFQEVLNTNLALVRQGTLHRATMPGTLQRLRISLRNEFAIRPDF